MSTERGFSPALLAVVGLGAALRLPRVIARWDEIALAYAAYAAPAMDAVATADLRDPFFVPAGQRWIDGGRRRSPK